MTKSFMMIISVPSLWGMEGNIEGLNTVLNLEVVVYLSMMGKVIGLIAYSQFIRGDICGIVCFY